MDGKVLTMEATRLERERRADASLMPPTPEPPSNEAVGLTDTVVYQHRVVELDESRRERERILAPGAGGRRGGPYKMLRTQVMRRLHELGANTLAVLSPSKGEGKTLTALNLAIAIAADLGHTALVVDLDLRNPSLHQRLGFDPELGVEDCLMHHRPVYEAMVKVAGYDRLTVLPSRTRVEQSSELVAAQRMGELVQELRTRYYNRILIFDLPPVLLADDALAFSRHVQAGLFVVAEGKTERDGVKRSLELLHNLTIIGTVLNRSRENSVAYY